MKGMYGAGSIPTDGRVTHFDKVRSEGFARTVPLKSNQLLFSYFVDLKTRVADTFDEDAVALELMKKTKIFY